MSLSHLAGDGDLRLGRRFGPRGVGVAAPEPQPGEQHRHQLPEEGVVPEELRGDGVVLQILGGGGGGRRHDTEYYIFKIWYEILN